MSNEIIFLLHSFTLLSATCGAFFISPRLLSVLACMQVVCANIFVVRQMRLCSLTACGGGMYIVGSMTALLLLQRFVSEQEAQTTVRLSVAVSLLFSILTLFQLAYEPAPYNTMHDFFVVLIGRVPRITIASLCAHYLSHTFSLSLTRMFSRLWPAAIAATLSLWICQVIDSALFFTGAFLGVTPVTTIAHMVLVSFGIKAVMIAVSSIMLWYAEPFLKDRHAQ